MSFAKIVKNVQKIVNIFPCDCSSSVNVAPISMMAKFVRERDLIKYQKPETSLTGPERPKMKEVATVKVMNSDIMEMKEMCSEVTLVNELETEIMEVKEFSTDLVKIEAQTPGAIMNVTRQVSDIMEVTE